MSTRALHRIIGILMLLPFTGWALTGAFFFLKPGYAGAYETLQVRTYPLEMTLELTPDPARIEARVVKTILGEHLLARTTEGWQHLDPRTMQPRPYPSQEEIRTLVADASRENPVRYGTVSHVEGGGDITTDTGVHISLDWNRLTLAQRGKDTDLIDALYKIHYLQWTGNRPVDRVLGALGILLVFALSALGARLFFRRG